MSGERLDACVSPYAFRTPANTALERFLWSRQVMMLAWCEWLATSPDARDVEAELSGTCNGMERFRTLRRGRRGE